MNYSRLKITTFCFTASVLFASAARADFPVMNARDKQVVEQVVSIFENDRPEIEYHYVENIHDGRGITAGIMGATSRTGDLLEVVQDYANTAKHPNPELIKFLPILKAVNGTDSTKGLERFPLVWWAVAKYDPNYYNNPTGKKVSYDPDLNVSQDRVNDKENFNPALDLSQKAGVQTKLGVLCFYDTIIQMGYQGLSDVMAKLKKRDSYSSEEAFLLDFLEIRRAAMLNPSEAEGGEATKKDWTASIGRVDVLETLVKQSASTPALLDLSEPFTVNYGGTFNLPAPLGQR